MISIILIVIGVITFVVSIIVSISDKINKEKINNESKKEFNEKERDYPLDLLDFDRYDDFEEEYGYDIPWAELEIGHYGKDYKWPISDFENIEFEKINHMRGQEFERFVAELLAANGYSEVNITKASGDNGVDILAKKDGVKYAFQCKRYSKSVGNHSVQEVFSGKAFYQADYAVVVTNSSFTPAAVEMAKKIGVLLWDGEYLNRLIKESDLKKSKE